MGVPKGLQNYHELHELGQGSSASAVLVECVNGANRGKLYALKKISLALLDPKKKQYAENEVELLKVLVGPTIIRYYESFSSKDWIWIVMEYADGGNLSQLIANHKVKRETISTGTILDWFAQIVLGIMVMHSKKVLHRDIKTQNIFLVGGSSTKDQPVLKIGDFGVSKALSSTFAMAETLCGTPYYMAPEIFRREPYNAKSDMWSLGCVLYELTTLELPFDGVTMEELKEAIEKKDPKALPEGTNEDIVMLVNALLNKDPIRRPSIWEVSKLQAVSSRIQSFVAQHGCYDMVADVLQIGNFGFNSTAKPIAGDVPKLPYNLTLEKYWCHA
ncbi:MAG: serine/threonine-protein kinase Nek [Candidatus Pacebacteria bacterium]|nr:serine/threonine-protein kinase Nek [Candidatus Paceibacterota bacterium]